VIAVTEHHQPDAVIPGAARAAVAVTAGMPVDGISGARSPALGDEPATPMDPSEVPYRDEGDQR
jgi:hypothetical protein